MQEGWSVSALMDSDVDGTGGGDLGEVEDVIFNVDGEIISIVAEVGGWLDIGDTHVSVPWDQVQVEDPLSGAVIPISEENVDQYDAFEYSGLPGSRLGQEITPGLDDEELVGRAWCASELIDDYACLQGTEGPLSYG